MCLLYRAKRFFGVLSEMSVVECDITKTQQESKQKAESPGPSCRTAHAFVLYVCVR
jgi:hypothetical protein